MAAAKRVLRYLCSTSSMGLVLGGRRPMVLTGHADASWADDQATQWSSQGYSFSLGSGFVSWRSTRSSSVLSSSCEAEIYAGAMAAQELRWLTYLLTDLGEQPRSPPVLYVDNKAMLALCREHRLEHRTKHIALHYFLAREVQQCGQLRLAYVASQANIADIFTKALPPGDHQYDARSSFFALLDWSCDLLFSPTLPMGFLPAHCQVFTSPRSLQTWDESVHTGYRASSGSCVCSSVRVRSGSRLLLVSPPVAPDSSVAPLPGSPLSTTPSWHAISSSFLWSSQVPASPGALACPALPPLRRGAAARCSSLLVSPDDCSPADSRHGRVGPSPRQWTEPRALLCAGG
ncbi:unnamed protein product [Closterium sp. NIES-53]